MNEQTFADQIEQLFLAIEHWLEATSDEIDFESDQGRLKIQIDHSQWILSKQTALNEIWLATPAGAYHFHLQDSRWVTNANQELIQILAQTIQKATSISLNPNQFNLEG